MLLFNKFCKKAGNMIIRYAEIADYLWLKDHEKHISEEILRTKIETKEIYVVQENNELIGWLRYNLFWDNVPFMNLIYFLEKYRRNGIGKKLLNHWENEMRQKGYKNVLTSTLSNEEAQHFYRKMGYTEIGGLKYLDDALEIIFYKKLS
jgi:ribosomal protein S18 acetylase RimI-like enzyme